MLLLIGCANVPILLLARGISRRYELSVRAAVGATRNRILRQLLTYSLIISILKTSGTISLKLVIFRKMKLEQANQEIGM